VIEIEHDRGHVMNFESGRISEDQHLNNRRTDENEARALVAEHLDELLDQHLLQARRASASPLLQPLVE
jgi:hypothetical protein